MLSTLFLIGVAFDVLQCVSSQDKVDRSVGEKCVAKTYEGTCRKIADCAVVLRQIHVWGSHNYTRCNYDRRDEVACCPDANTTSQQRPSTPDGGGGTELREPSMQRLSEEYCDRYSKSVKGVLGRQIINGKNASEGEFPHMAALGSIDVSSGEMQWLCGGSLISYDYVLTAAHCIINQRQARPVLIRLGRLNLLADVSQRGQDIEVDNITVHENFVPRTRMNDIALIKLKRPIVSTTVVHPACLYTRNDDPPGLIVTGWGSTSATRFNASLTALQKATLEPVPYASCNETFTTMVQRGVFTSQICAQSVNSQQDACASDSGGPLQVTDRVRGNIRSIVGITSLGIGCAGGTPGIYTRVASYLDWIESRVWQ